ncbi:efflux RND transporter periplasmic adaptor subunit [Demequina mangrovi]|uniref:Membrane fusion protein, macrolide-specific efflux system n=1 Tax=Demequina mangrovi TaxID=1043493 RepID=A0A1H6Z8Y0_9MICO|nr:biotin/lipoyl-binding protein [Demequina mangrovi]SEJ48454.1 membrane fusion protein, macrolide-specific efflux system [Demequina mangrovi]
MPQNSSRWNRARTWVVPTGTLLAGAGLGAGAMALWGSADEPVQADRSMEAAGQQTVTVGLETLEESVSASGSLVAVTTDSLAFEASGTVTKVKVEAGDHVEAGDVIARIDTLQLTASLRSAEAELAQAEAKLANLEDADDGSDASEAQIAAAEAQVEVLEESVADAEEAMDDAKLVADISGLVTSQPYEVGDVVSGGGSASSGMGGATTAASTSSSSGVTIVGLDEWTVSVSLSEDEVSQVEEGDQVTFTADDVDGEFFGIVTDIANLPTTTGGSATYAVDLQVTGDVEGLYEGTSVTAEIITLRRVDVLAVPTNAITTADGVSTVTVVDSEGEETAREVTLGETIGSYSEVTDGLEEGEEIVVTVMASGGTDSETSEEGFGQMGGGFPTDGSFPGGGEMPTGGMGGMPGQ